MVPAPFIQIPHYRHLVERAGSCLHAAHLTGISDFHFKFAISNLKFVPLPP